MRPFILIGLIFIFTSCKKEEKFDPNITIDYTPETTFQWILNDEVNANNTPYFDYIDIDGFESSAETVAALKGKGMKVIGYISVGSWEDWRPDITDFPAEIIGNNYDGWEGEKWLDISNLTILGPILEARMDMLVEKGFDGIEPDNLDGYETNTGFNLTQEQTLTFCKWLAAKAHERGLTIGQKNISNFTDQLVDQFDWVLTEDAFAQGWEAEVQAYRIAGKPVFMVEYTDENIDANAACTRAQELDYTLLIKQRDLDTWYLDCDGQ